MFVLPTVRLLVGEELVSDLGPDPKAQAVNQPTSAVFSVMKGGGCSPEQVGTGLWTGLLWTECPPLRPFSPFEEKRAHV